MGKKNKKKEKETLDNIKPHKELSSDVYLGFVERALVAGNLLDTALAEHSVYELHPAIRKKIDQIIDQCADLYQLSAYLMFKQSKKEEKSENQKNKKN